ncbi:permease prefix domain 1-containing protein [Dactylosporangium roseum]|nr:permease prefix domain 1-containing protein [Dactylosporangium roseum]
MAGGPIDAYVASLRGALRGPRGAKADLVREARDSLFDAAEHYERDGLDRAEAERLAVDEFGDVRELAPDYQRELALAQARRTALLVALAVATQTVVSEIAWRTAATSWSWQPDRFYAILANTVDYAGYAVFVGALLAAATCGIGTRFRTVGRPFARATGIAAITVVGFFLLGGAALSLLSPAWHTATLAATPLGLTSAAITTALPAWMLYSGFRCIRAAA